MTGVADRPPPEAHEASYGDPTASPRRGFARVHKTDDGLVGFLLERVARLAATARPVVASVTSTGWTVLGLGVAAWPAGSQLGWVELRMISVGAVALFCLCALLTLGRTNVAVELSLDPQRVVAGQVAAGRVVVTNRGRARLLPVTLEVPIGESSASFDLPSLRPGAPHEELFVVQTTRRGVVAIGPARTVRGDPLGLFRRSLPWTGMEELYVHPVTVPLETLGSGLIRDLEGQSTADLSVSDLAFHALREYVPGDDWRHIHWKSSARSGSTGTGGAFMVKQYLDTRRSSLTVVVDAQESSYVSVDDFEIAVSAAASIAVRAIRDGIETTVLVADQIADALPGQATLDRFARAEIGTGFGIDGQARRAVRLALDTSIAVLVSGARLEVTELHRAASRFPTEVNVLGLRVDPARPPGISVSSSVTLLTLGHLGDLSAIVKGGMR